jgi:hypothetical protein
MVHAAHSSSLVAARDGIEGLMDYVLEGEGALDRIRDFKETTDEVQGQMNGAMLAMRDWLREYEPPSETRTYIMELRSFDIGLPGADGLMSLREGGYRPFYLQNWRAGVEINKKTHQVEVAIVVDVVPCHPDEWEGGPLAVRIVLAEGMDHGAIKNLSAFFRQKIQYAVMDGAAKFVMNAKTS